MGPTPKPSLKGETMSSKAVEPSVSIVPSIMSEDDKARLRDQFDRRIAEADSVDALFDKPKTLGLEDIEGEPVVVNAVRFNQARPEYAKGEGSLGAFVVMELGDGRVVTTGARTPLMILYRVAELGGFPLTLRFYRNRTGNDRDAWDVERYTD